MSNSRVRRSKGWTAALLCLAGAQPVVLGAQVPDSVSVLADLSLEELMDIRITSVSKQDERLFDAAGAVQVVSREDIRRSGATSIPEVLRLVPGLQVNRHSANDFVVTSRGFGDVFANKLLVLIDGRNLYSPLFAGVRWEEHQLLLEEIDRIEVIRGPGAALWGANAVNGVINIVTLPAQETQGTLVSATGSGGDASRFATRFGSSAGGVPWRAHAQYFSHGGFAHESGEAFPDDWRGLQGGFRSDWNSGRSTLSLMADAARYEFGKISDFASLEPPYRVQTALDDEVTQWNLHGVWGFEASEASTFGARVYYDFIDRDVEDDRVEHREFDVELQHTLRTGRHEMVWGLQYRRFEENLFGTSARTMVPERRTDHLLGAFLQDRFHLTENLNLTLGSKIERNDYTGVEVQPSAKAAWQLTSVQTAWASVSRALRTPSRADRDVRFLAEVIPLSEDLLAHAVLSGSPDSESEELLAYEIGYRHRIGSVSIDVAAFLNEYKNLRVEAVGEPSLQEGPEGPFLLLPISHASLGEGQSHGVEVSAKWAISNAWRLEGAFSRLKLERTQPGSITKDSDNGKSPRSQGQLRSLLNLGPAMELDLWVRFTSGIKHGALRVPSYLGGDVRLGWSPAPGIRLDVGGKDLLEGAHLEFPPDQGFFLGSWVDRSWYGKVTWTF